MSDGGWTLTPHCCRHCGIGRVLERDGTLRCSLCGVEAKGRVAALCACGVPGYRCAPNPARTAANPYEIIPQMVGEAPAAKPARKARAPVAVDGGLFGG